MEEFEDKEEDYNEEENTLGIDSIIDEDLQSKQ